MNVVTTGDMSRRHALPRLLRAAAGPVAVASVAMAAGWSTESSQVRHYVDPSGWSVAYPGGMYLERSRAGFDRALAEVTIASFPMLPAVKSGSTKNAVWVRTYPPRGTRGIFPAGGVAVRIVPGSSRPPWLQKPVAHERKLVADGRDYTAQIWLGDAAPTALRLLLDRIVSSFAASGSAGS